MKRHFLFLGIITTLVSCSVDNVDYDVNNALSNKLSTSNQYSISEEEALANLYAFMGQGGNSRSSDSRVVQTILPVKYSQLGSRAVEGIDCDNLLYVANFENEEGYAVLAGDTRIEDEVIAITDDGSLDAELLNHIVEWEDNVRANFEGYPTTGPGFYTTPETGDEVFMNPNTVVLYDETEQDHLTGNFDPNWEWIGSRSSTTDNGLMIDSTPEALALSMCVTYATRGIIDFDPNPRDDGEEGNTRTVVTTSSWTDATVVGPLLTDYKYWHQRSPFNDLYPTRRKYVVVGASGTAPAGCFPLAIAKVLTHFAYPTSFTFNGYTVNWAELDSSYSTMVGQASAAALLRSISSGCDSWYFYEGTFTFPGRAVSYMSSLGLQGVDNLAYSFDRVRNMIDDNAPLIIYSIPGINITKSHAWNIDGYKIKQRTITTEVYVDDVLQSTTTETESKRMVHCDFGWSGRCNGYYVSGVFDLDDPNIEYDEGSEYDKTTNYNNLLRVITYTKPL